MAEWAISQVSGADTAVRDRLARSGLLPATGGLTSRSGLFAGGAVTLTSGMAVSVAPLRAYIQGTSIALQGGYFAVLDTAKTLTFADGGASNRTDLIVAQIYENTADASGFTKFEVIIVQGVGGGGVPATPANAVKLAEKVITAGMSAGTGGLGTAPTDKRPPRLVGAGGAIPVADATDRATLDVYDGLVVYRIDTAVFEVRVAGAWERLVLDKDSGWVNLTPHAVFTSGTVRYRRRGNTVWAQVDGAAATVSGTEITLTTAAIPAALRPSVQVRGGGYFAGHPGVVTVGTDGILKAVQNSGGARASVAAVVSWPVEA